ncbi:MAG: hypothetical protein AAF228_10395 [Pseudomonadota bacterium]
MKYEQTHIFFSGITKKMIFTGLFLCLAGCSSVPYPDLPGLRMITGQVLSKEEQQKMLTDMKKQRDQQQQGVRKETVANTESNTQPAQNNIQPAIVQ